MRKDWRTAHDSWRDGKNRKGETHLSKQFGFFFYADHLFRRIHQEHDEKKWFFLFFPLVFPFVIASWCFFFWPPSSSFPSIDSFVDGFQQQRMQLDDQFPSPSHASCSIIILAIRECYSKKGKEKKQKNKKHTKVSEHSMSHDVNIASIPHIHQHIINQHKPEENPSRPYTPIQDVLPSPIPIKTQRRFTTSNFQVQCGLPKEITKE